MSYADYIYYLKKNGHDKECRDRLEEEADFWLQEAQRGFDEMIIRSHLWAKESLRLQSIQHKKDFGTVLQCKFCLDDIELNPQTETIVVNYRFVHKNCWAWQEALNQY